MDPTELWSLCLHLGSWPRNKLATCLHPALVVTFFHTISGVRLPPSCLAFAPEIVIIYTSADHLQRGALDKRPAFPHLRLTLVSPSCGCLSSVSSPRGTATSFCYKFKWAAKENWKSGNNIIHIDSKNECEICHQHTHSGTRLEAKLQQKATCLHEVNGGRFSKAIWQQRMVFNTPWLGAYTGAAAGRQASNRED